MGCKKTAQKGTMVHHKEQAVVPSLLENTESQINVFLCIKNRAAAFFLMPQRQTGNEVPLFMLLFVSRISSNDPCAG